MNEWKEVWYVWDGAGDIPSDSIRAADYFGEIETKNIHPSWWVKDEADKLNFSAYTTGQMRRRAECSSCDGRGSEIGFDNECGWAIEYGTACPSCNGKTHEWEYKQ